MQKPKKTSLESKDINLPQMIYPGELNDGVIHHLIKFNRETNQLDFKLTFSISDKDKCFQYAKDCTAFANIGGGYLVIGVEPHTHRVVGIDESVKKSLDPTRVSQTISKYVSPDINLHTYVGKHNNCSIGLIYVPSFKKRPHFIKKDFHVNHNTVLHAGTIYIRRDTATKTINEDSWEELLERYYEKTHYSRDISVKRSPESDPFDLEREQFFKILYKELKNE